jgi:hypothetical protein
MVGAFLLKLVLLLALFGALGGAVSCLRDFGEQLVEPLGEAAHLVAAVVIDPQRVVVLAPHFAGETLQPAERSDDLALHQRSEREARKYEAADNPECEHQVGLDPGDAFSDEAVKLLCGVCPQFAHRGDHRAMVLRQAPRIGTLAVAIEDRLLEAERVAVDRLEERGKRRFQRRRKRPIAAHGTSQIATQTVERGLQRARERE